MTDMLVITDNQTTLDEPVIESTEAFQGMTIDDIPTLPPEKNDNITDSIFIVVEEKPEFPGGEQTLLKWIASNIKYPSIAIQNGVQGIVFINFVVDRDSGISNARVVRECDPSLDQEALRVLNKLPKWKPGLQRGIPVRVSYTIPIHFKLQQS